MKHAQRVASVCATGVAPCLVPGFILHAGQPFPWIVLFAAASAIGSGLVACVLGGVALYAGRQRADHGLRTALGVALVAGVLLAAVTVYGIRAS